MKPPANALWELPDVLFFRVLTFVAASTNRASVLCHQIGMLCHLSHSKISDGENSVWDIILYEDYGVMNKQPVQKKKRMCRRLYRTPLQRVRDAHQLINTNTEIAFFYISERVHSRTKKLSKVSVIKIIEEYGPRLRLNRNLSTGGTFLVEICRAKYVSEKTVLGCVKELVEHREALVDMRTRETERSSQTALAVAAVRGMASVTEYLLRAGADPGIRSTGRFFLYSDKKKSLRCDNVTPLEFVLAMIDAERHAGATKNDLNGLKKCKRLLSRDSYER